MDAIDIAFRLAGGFYLFAGWFGVRAILMDSVLDKALAALSAGKEDPRERGRRWAVGASTVVVGASGAALATMSAWALPLFLASVAAQAVWIGGARRIFIDPAEDDEASRRQVVNAAILYGAVAVGVVWLWGAGRMAPFDEPVGVVATALAFAGLALWLVRHMAWDAASPSSFAPPPDEKEDDSEAPARIVIAPKFGWQPLINADTGRRFSHFRWIEHDLALRVEEWDDGFQMAFSADDAPSGPDFPSAEDEAAWRAEGHAVAEALRDVYGHDNVGFGPGWDARDA